MWFCEKSISLQMNSCKNIQGKSTFGKFKKGGLSGV